MAALCAVLLSLNGCRKHTGTDAAEQEHPRMQKAAQLLQQQDLDGAEAIFQALLARDPSFASAHLQLGMVAQRRQDPVSAIFHFREYLKQRGDSSKAPIVEQMVQSELIRIVDNHPAVRAMLPPDVLALQDQLSVMRDRLNAAEERAARAELSLGQARGQNGAPAVNPNPARITELEAQLAELRRENERLRSSAPAATPRPVTGAQTAAPPAGSRTYTVVRGDNLSAISQKVYGTPHRWQEILDANRTTLPSANRLSVGQTLVIP